MAAASYRRRPDGSRAGETNPPPYRSEAVEASTTPATSGHRSVSITASMSAPAATEKQRAVVGDECQLWAAPSMFTAAYIQTAIVRITCIVTHLLGARLEPGVHSRSSDPRCRLAAITLAG